MSRKEFVIILSITFLVVMAWVIFDILHSKPSIPINPKIEQLLTPIDPNLDTATIDQVNKNFSSLNQAPTFQPEATPVPSVLPTSNPQLSPLPSPTTAAATDSAQQP